MTVLPVIPDETGRAAHDSQRVLPRSVSDALYTRLCRELGSGVVLDVGAGSGVVAAELARAGCRVVMTDVVDWHPVDLPFVLADAATLPFPSGTCTGVHVARVLHHVADWRAVLREAVRVLAPDGALCLSLGDKPVVDGLRALVDRAVEAAELQGLRQSPVAGPDLVDVTAYLADLGWSAVTTFEFGADVAVTPRDVLMGTLGNPFRWQPDQDLSAIPTLVAEVLADLDADTQILRDRTVRYSMYRT